MAAKSSSSAKHRSGHPGPSGRVTPPTPKKVKESPRWLPVVIFGLLGIGMLLVILDYSGVLPGSPNNWMLLPALLCFSGGLFAAMGYR